MADLTSQYNTECPKKIAPFSKMFLWAPDVILESFIYQTNRSINQSKLGVSSSNQCNLHHSPHTGHLEKKIKKGFNLFQAFCINEARAALVESCNGA